MAGFEYLRTDVGITGTLNTSNSPTTTITSPYDIITNYAVYPIKSEDSANNNLWHDHSKGTITFKSHPSSAFRNISISEDHIVALIRKTF